MRTRLVLLTIIGAFFSALIIFLIVVYKPAIPSVLTQFSDKKSSQAVSSENDSINDLKSKIKWLEGNINELSKKQQLETKVLQDLKTFTSTQSAGTPTPINIHSSNGKLIFAIAYTRGSAFTTTSTAYTPMGMYVNINCPKSCLLWINFYSSSKNLGSPASAQGNFNTYGVFLDEVDQSIYSQASFPVASSAIPVALNVTIPVAAGVHTIDIRAKTTGGTLQSDSSALQVMAIER